MLAITTASDSPQEQEQSLYLATRQARGLEQQLLTKLKSFFLVQESKQQLEKFQTTVRKEEILRRQDYIKHLQQKLSTQARQLLQTHLQTALALRGVPQKKSNTIVLACGDISTYKKIKEELGEYVSVVLAQRDQELFDLLSYEQIRVIPGEESELSGAIEEIEQVKVFSTTAVEELFPERYVLTLEQQPEQVAALQALKHLIATEVPSITLLPKTTTWDRETLRSRLEKDCQRLQEGIEEVLEQERFSGNIFSKVLQGQTTLFNELQESHKQRIIALQKELAQQRELLFAFPFTKSIILSALGKVEVDNESFESEYKEAVFFLQERRRESQVSLAKQAKTLLDSLSTIKDELYELDFAQAVIRFHEEYDLSFPTLQDQGIDFVYGRNMHISPAVPVAYQLSEQQPIAILTGANSGGKTTLMELLAQIQLLTQMGFGVPAKVAKVGVVQELYYFSKSKGTLGAGAFETMLGQFAKLATKKGTAKLVLADEIESVTEPDVAARIIKGILHMLSTHEKTTTLLVTHVGRELEKLGCPARFDGIEAKGLDKDFALVVDRNPIIGTIARSTPQLIIERLAKTKQEKFYRELLDEITG